MDTENGGDLDVRDTEPEAPVGDREYDNLEDAVAAIQDDYEDPDEEQPDEPEDEPEEGEAEGDEDSEAEDADDDPEEGDEVEDGDAVVALPGGEEITVSELEQWRANGLRQADYTQKTQELAREREKVEQLEQTYSQRLQVAENALTNLTEKLQGLIPEEPPLSLAQSDPNKYQYQLALRNNALKEIQGWVSMKDELDQTKGQASEEDRNRYIREEGEKLAKAMPHLSDPARRQSFDKAVKETASEFGFSEDEIANTHDSRVLQLVHYARLGRKAEHNRNNAKRRVETPKQGKAKPAKANQDKNRQAMQRLSKSGSYEDALRVDFD